MPPKRKTTLLKKENQLLVTRLMQISLEVDKHVYKNQPISGHAARDYVRELAKLSGQRGQDARTKQVIEKLTRQMKCIITEDENTFVPPSQDITETHVNATIFNEHISEQTQREELSNDTVDNINNNENAETNVSAEENLSENKRDIITNMEKKTCNAPSSIDLSTIVPVSQSILSNTDLEYIEHNSKMTELKGVLDKPTSKITTKVKPKFLPPAKSKKPDKTVLLSNCSNKTNVTFEINSQSLDDTKETEKQTPQVEAKQAHTQKQDKEKQKKQIKNKKKQKYKRNKQGSQQ